jgi:hypothetical protein
MGSCQSVSSKEVKSDQKHKGKPQILVKTFTWSRDSHGLFDYESKTLAKKNMKSITDGLLFRRGNEIIMNKEGVSQTIINSLNLSIGTNWRSW